MNCTAIMIVKDLLSLNTVRQKDEKPHTTGDTAILHTKIKITDISLERKLNPAIP